MLESFEKTEKVKHLGRRMLNGKRWRRSILFKSMIYCQFLLQSHKSLVSEVWYVM